ncbi:MAG: tRNA guanosine(34) transglycosylase Tgt [Candidatus Delongbacteria bacterium]|nr:tRNA guanosine(34) transglycosylase Tgt [Candidatus Delongbacteria bacterium]
MKFSILARDGSARRGQIQLERGIVETPIFMPIGTRGSVKTLERRDLDEMGAQIILANSYHLYLRPGIEFLEDYGGIHQFIKWDRPLLTDSGGYQVFSLSELNHIKEDGVYFRSHLDGSRHIFTPESNVTVQRAIGADIIMALDECQPWPVTRDYALDSLQRTTRWAERFLEAFNTSHPLYGQEQVPFAIVQGSVYDDLRAQSAEDLMELDFPGYAIGGLSVGEPKEDMYRITRQLGESLPQARPRYLMGVGTPLDIVESVAAGIDMFDCVIPTRNARNSTVFTRQGKLQIKAVRHSRERGPLDPECGCYTCRTYDRAHLRYLFHVNEFSAMRLATIHNLTYYLDLMQAIRESIASGVFEELRQQVTQAYREHDETG